LFSDIDSVKINRSKAFKKQQKIISDDDDVGQSEGKNQMLIFDRFK
jgi:hypothetical protein